MSSGSPEDEVGTEGGYGGPAEVPHQSPHLPARTMNLSKALTPATAACIWLPLLRKDVAPAASGPFTPHHQRFLEHSPQH